MNYRGLKVCFPHQYSIFWWGDLRASVASQQKQLESLIDRVALLLSSMHSEVDLKYHHFLDGRCLAKRCSFQSFTTILSVVTPLAFWHRHDISSVNMDAQWLPYWHHYFVRWDVELSRQILQDMRIAVASPDFEARLAEMRNVGEAKAGWDFMQLKAYQAYQWKGELHSITSCKTSPKLWKTVMDGKLTLPLISRMENFPEAYHGRFSQVLDQRLAEMRAEAATVPEGVRSA